MLKVPYNMVAAVDPHKRHAQMAVALYHGYPRLKQQPLDDTKSLTIACYGPSLEQTWQRMQRPILSMSGATRWLSDRGMVPDYHIDMDPRAHKVKHLDPPVPGVHYLMATICHPDTWKLLQGQNVTVWHAYSAPSTYEVVSSIDHGELVVHGGSTIGLTALHIGGILGYRHFEIHGMDGSFADDARSRRHAGVHYGTIQQDRTTWQAGGKVYQTSRIMSNAVAETINSMANFPMFCVFHGEGLTQAMIRKHNLPNACCADETDKAEQVRRATAHILDPILVRDQMSSSRSDAWERLCGPYTPELLSDMQIVQGCNEWRRQKAKYNTGSVTVEQMMQLRALCLKQQPKTIVEVGTFIGNSTLAMRAEHIYTCDRDNDCLPSQLGLTTFPGVTSTRMFQQLMAQGVKADLFFFDGRIVSSSRDFESEKRKNLALIKALSHQGTIYVFDDYTDEDPKGKGRRAQKGIINAKLIIEILENEWCLLEPDDRLAGKSTLAAIVPRSLVA